MFSAEAETAVETSDRYDAIDCLDIQTSGNADYQFGDSGK
jgi:hypothetical protein